MAEECRLPLSPGCTPRRARTARCRLPLLRAGVSGEFEEFEGVREGGGGEREVRDGERGRGE